MESIVHLHVEKLPEGLYLATSDDIPGVVAQGRTVQETIEIARDVAKKPIEVRASRGGPLALAPIADHFNFPMVVGA